MNEDILTEKLERHRVAMTADEFFEAVLEALDPAVSETVTDAEMSYLREFGGPSARRAFDDPNALERARAHRARTATHTAVSLIADSLDVPAVAELLGLDRSSVNRRIQNHQLWAFRIDGRNRLPRWQFAGGAPLPGLSDVVVAIPPSAAPAAVGTLMLTPQEELDDATPVEHLAGGGAPEPVAAIVAELEQW